MIIEQGTVTANTQIGEQSVAMLLSRLANPDLAVRKVQLDARFVHRESCGCRADEPEGMPAEDGRPAAAAAERSVPAVDEG